MSQTVASVVALDTPVEVLETSVAGNYQAKVNVSDLEAGDRLVIRGYQKDDAADPAEYFASIIIDYDTDIDGNTYADDWYTPLPWTIESGQYLGIELTIIAATGAFPRTFKCSMTNLATNA